MIHSYETPAGTRFVRASWDQQRGQYTSQDVPPSVASSVQGYQYTFGRSLEALVSQGVRSYPTQTAAELAEAGFQSPVEYRRRVLEARQDALDWGESDPTYEERVSDLLKLAALVARREAELGTVRRLASEP